MFRMLKGESIADVQKRFTHIVNHLMSLGKVFDKEEINLKIMKCLDRSWQPKVIAISESKDLTSMTIASLFGKLREHELEMDRLNLQENEDRGVKTIALKAFGNKNYQDSSDESEEETFILLFKKFRKFLKKRNNKSDSFNMYDSKKPTEFNTNKYTCFGCGEQVHIKTECPNKERKNFKKHEKKGKSRSAYNDDSSSSSSSDEEEANVCLMIRQESDISSVCSNTSINFEDYSQLLDAFNETHEEANRLTLLNKRLKGLNNSLENIVKILEEELNNSKSDFENLEMIYQNSYCKCVDSSFCENCESLQKKVHYLLKMVDKFSKGQSNLETVLVSQKCVFGKAGLGFNPNRKNKFVSKPFSSFFEKQPVVLSKQSVEICHYCMKRGHTIRFCRVRRFSLPKGILKWVSKVLRFLRFLRFLLTSLDLNL